MTHVFDTFSGVRVQRARRGNRFIVTSSQDRCMTLWVDRGRWDYDELAVLRPDDLAVVEVYPRNVPEEFRTREGCGAVVVWTKRYLR